MGVRGVLEKLEWTTMSIELMQETMSELDVLARKQRIEKNEIIDRAVKQYISQQKVRDLRVEMERGYAEMANINFAIACECTHVESEAEDKNIRVLGG